MQKHIAWDIGAAGLTRALAKELRASAVLNPISRLVIDVNRGLKDPTLIVECSDGVDIPGNYRLSLKEVDRRVESFYLPYHRFITDALQAASSGAAVISIHSFTPRLHHGPVRPWHIGVVWEKDDRVSKPLLQMLREASDLLSGDFGPGTFIVGDNQPYGGHLEGDTLSQHALGQGRPHVLLEVRQDLISTPAEQEKWAKRLGPVLRQSIDSSLIK
jgi:predicted N-formylglutamate amidohydrolase